MNVFRLLCSRFSVILFRQLSDSLNRDNNAEQEQQYRKDQLPSSALSRKSEQLFISDFLQNEKRAGLSVRLNSLILISLSYRSAPGIPGGADRSPVPVAQPAS